MLVTPRAGCDWHNSNTPIIQSIVPHAGCNETHTHNTWCCRYLFQSNAPRAGCNSKTIQSKRILAARRMCNFANCVLHILKHLLTYCIGITLRLLIFGAKLPAFLCQLKVRTILIALLYHTSPHPASAFVAIKRAAHQTVSGCVS